MTSMQEQTFGVEVEMTHITRKDAAQVIAEYLGGRVHYAGGVYDTYEVIDGDRVWKLMRDGSIHDDYDHQTEFVTPVCHWEDIETVQEIIRRLRKAGAREDPSCGIHVHVGAQAHTAKTLRNLVNIVNAKEDLLTQALAISADRRDHWCAPVNQEFLARLNKQKPKTTDELAELWYDDRDWRYRAHQHYDHTRYHLLNLHAFWQKGTVEFRAFNSTLHAGKIKAYIQLCLAINWQALTASSASPRPTVTDNPAYTFRCWLLRLGFIGDEFKTARTHLMANLDGDSAWRDGRRAS